DICSRVLRLHRSSAERRASLEAFYNVIWDETGLPTNVLDVAAGLNAFALPWMGLPAETRYHALEIDRRLCSATDRLLCATGLPGEATWSDVLSDFSPGTPDVALILKTLPCLEQQEPGASDAILTALASVPLIVITFPVRSLGGQEKGMRENYLDQIERLAGRNHRDLTVLPFDDELIAILRRAES
ncbi:MAG: 16S rRNA methyltransferase, partial [Rhodospirillaceae bacterium]|nr:16S rRNA methyltransferase [Rhodospirillaceae bacterium]